MLHWWCYTCEFCTWKCSNSRFRTGGWRNSRSGTDRWSSGRWLIGRYLISRFHSCTNSTKKCWTSRSCSSRIDTSSLRFSCRNRFSNYSVNSRKSCEIFSIYCTNVWFSWCCEKGCSSKSFSGIIFAVLRWPFLTLTFDWLLRFARVFHLYHSYCYFYFFHCALYLTWILWSESLHLHAWRINGIFIYIFTCNG